MQAGKGLVMEEDLDPYPTTALYPETSFEPLKPSYADYMNNEPSPFKPDGPFPRDPMSCVTLLQPYLAPEPILEQRRKPVQSAKLN